MSSSRVGSNESKKQSAIEKVFFAVMYIILVVVVVVTVLFFIWVLFNLNIEIFIKPKDAVVRLVSFSTTNFNITDGDLTATWEPKFAIENPNKEFKATFARIETSIFYKEQENGLANGFKGSFNMDKKSNTTIIIKSSISKRDHQPQRWVVDDIEKERNGGAVSFRLGISLDIIFKTESQWIWNVIFRDVDVSCGDLKLVFAAGSTTGTLANGHLPKECS